MVFFSVFFRYSPTAAAALYQFFLFCFCFFVRYLTILLLTPPPLLCRFPFQSSPLNSSINAKAVAVTFWMQTLANITTSSDSSTLFPRRQHAPALTDDDDDEEGPNQNLISSWWVPAIWCWNPQHSAQSPCHYWQFQFSFDYDVV